MSAFVGKADIGQTAAHFPRLKEHTPNIRPCPKPETMIRAQADTSSTEAHAAGGDRGPQFP
jgi:hypothetical protein